MKLLTLTLRNFQGIKDFTLDAQGHDVTITGDNGAGKTTLASAWSWLLTDKDSLGRSDFEIKTLTPEGEALHGMEHEVEAVLDIGLALKKVYSEKWTKARGALKASFSGHETKYYLDGVPVTKRAYDDRVAEIAPGDLLRLLTDPMAFNDLHWQRRREILLEVCGDVPDTEVIASDPDLADLPEILGKRTMDQHKAVVREQQKKIREELREIDTRVKEAGYNLPDIGDIDPEKLATDIARQEKALEEARADKARIEARGDIAEKVAEIAELVRQINETEAEARKTEMEATGEIQAKLTAVQRTIKDTEANTRHLERGIADLEQVIARHTRALADLDAEAKTVEAGKRPGEDICPACGQALPPDKVKEAVIKFDMDKARKLEQINAEAKRHKEFVALTARQLEEAKDYLAQDLEIISELMAKDADIQAELDALALDGPSLTVCDLLGAKARLEGELELLQSDRAIRLEEAQGRHDYHHDVLQGLKLTEAKFAKHQEAQARIDELKAQEKDLSRKHEALTRQQWLCDKFTRAKVRMLDERINSRFALARFKLFQEQVNGDLAEVCETTYQGVPWGKGLNSGARIQVGIDIINTLSEHYGFTAPIFADNAESVTVLPETKAQLIRLVKPDIEGIAKVLVEDDDPEPTEQMRWNAVAALKKRYKTLQVEVKA